MNKNKYIAYGAVTGILLKGGDICLIDTEDVCKVKALSWYSYKRKSNPSKTHYCVHTNPDTKRQIRIHRLIVAAPDSFQVDHINGNGLDNRKINLRLCTNRQNMMNAVKHKNCTSKYKGVSFLKNRGAWASRIGPNGKIYLGYFKTELEAAEAYNSKAKQLYGTFAKLNAL